MQLSSTGFSLKNWGPTLAKNKAKSLFVAPRDAKPGFIGNSCQQVTQSRCPTGKERCKSEARKANRRTLCVDCFLLWNQQPNRSRPQLAAQQANSSPHTARGVIPEHARAHILPNAVVRRLQGGVDGDAMEPANV